MQSFVFALVVAGLWAPARVAVQDPATVAWLRERAQPLVLTPPEGGCEEFAFLDEAVAAARVVLLGEELHGVREFSALKVRIVRSLIERHGFDTLVLEQDSTRCAAIERALRSSTAAPAAELAQCYWCWNTGEFAELLGWLQHHNEHAARPVAFVGVDNQGFGDAPARLRELARGSTREALFDPEPALALFPAERGAYPKDDPAAVAAHAQKLAELRARVAAAGEQLGAEHAREALDAVRILEELFELWSAPNAQARMNRRDLHMAERTLALLRDPERKVLVWAHNAHASRAIYYGGVEPLGKHLAARVPTLVLGFYFGVGEVLLDPRARGTAGAATQLIATPPAGSLAATLAAVGGAAWVADLRAIEDDAARRFFAAPPAGHFDNYSAAPSLLGAIDMLVFVERVRPSSPPP